MHQEHQWIKLDNSERVMNKRTENNHQDFPANTSRGWTWVLEQGTPLMAWVNTCTIRVNVYFRSTLLKERESKVQSGGWNCWLNLGLYVGAFRMNLYLFHCCVRSFFSWCVAELKLLTAIKALYITGLNANTVVAYSPAPFLLLLLRT